MDWADEVAAKCISDGMGDGDTARLIATALRNEREACAALAEPSLMLLQGTTHGAWERGYISARKEIADCIRNR